MNPYHHVKQPRIRRSVSCDIPLGDGFVPNGAASDASTSFQRTSPVRRTSSPTHKYVGARSSIVRSTAAMSSAASFATPPLPPTTTPSSSGSPRLMYPPSSPTKRHSHTLSRPSTASMDRRLSASSHTSSHSAVTKKPLAATRRSSSTGPGRTTAGSVVAQWTKKRRRQRQLLMAKHFATWFVATLVVGHLGAQLHQQRHRPTSAVTLARKSSFSSMFTSGRKPPRPSPPITSLDIGPCEINGTMYVTPLLPTLLIVGAQKSGTTAMASILTHHELIRGPHPKSSEGQPNPVVTEGHFFDYHYRSLVDRSRYIGDNHEQTCWLRHKYAAQYQHSLMGGGTRSNDQVPHPTHHRALHEEGSLSSVVYLEKSPSYLLSPHVPEAVHRLVPESHILILLRNPVHRLLSQYRMMKQQQHQQQSTNKQITSGTVEPERGPRNSTERMLTVEGASSTQDVGRLRGRNQRPNNPIQPSFNDLELILNEELRMLQNPVRTYLTNVKGPRSKSRTEREFQFAIPPSPKLGSANYDAYYHWDDLARTPSNFRGFDRLLQRGMYSVQLERWIHAFGDHMEQGSNGDSGTIPGVGADEPRKERPPRPKNLIVIPYELFESHPLPVLDYLWRRLNVPSWTVPPSILRARYSIPGHDATSNSSSAAAGHGDASPELLNFLYDFYRPYNDRLADMLGEEWRGIWEHHPSTAGSGDDEQQSPSRGEDDDDAIDSDSEAWKQAWLHKVLME